MLNKLLYFLLSKSSVVRRWVSKLLFGYLTKVTKNKPVLFLNFGYAEFNQNLNKLELQEKDEADRICINLYHRVANAVDLKGVDVLELSSGHGGGASYVMRYLKPRSLVGIDINADAIAFCNENYLISGLSFIEGNSEEIQFSENTFDVVINVEASHYYSMKRFTNEVVRVLRPNGYLLFADLRTRKESYILNEQLLQSGLEIVEKENITPNVVKAIELAGEIREELTKDLAPPMLYRFIQQFSGGKESQIYQVLRSGEMVYVRYVLVKSNSEAH